jgi:acetyl esterase/lipase
LDPDRIAIGGGSAGAVTALFYGYADRAQGEGKSGNPGYSSKVKLVIPISGELRYDAFCKSIDASGEPVGCHYGTWNHTADIDPNLHPDQPPVLLVHGTADTVVPIREAYAVQARANETGLANKFIVIPGAGHVPTAQLENEPYVDAMTEYLVKSLDLETAECPKRGI